MAMFNFYLTNSANINDIDVELGNLIFCEDTRRVYFDNENGRVCYDSIAIFETQDEMFSFKYPTDGFYFVEETKVLWRYYNGSWIAITDPPINNVRFIPESDLPGEGDFEVLYVCGNKIFVWGDGEYQQISAPPVWQDA